MNVLFIGVASICPICNYVLLNCFSKWSAIVFRLVLFICDMPDFVFAFALIYAFFCFKHSRWTIFLSFFEKLKFSLFVVGPPAVAGIRIRLSVLPYFHLSVLPSGSFLGIGSLVFSETQHGVWGPCLVVRDRAGFFFKNLFAPKMGQKQGFFEFIGKFGH